MEKLKEKNVELESKVANLEANVKTLQEELKALKDTISSNVQYGKIMCNMIKDYDVKIWYFVPVVVLGLSLIGYKCYKK